MARHHGTCGHWCLQAWRTRWCAWNASRRVTSPRRRTPSTRASAPRRRSRRAAAQSTAPCARASLSAFCLPLVRSPALAAGAQKRGLRRGRSHLAVAASDHENPGTKPKHKKKNHTPTRAFSGARRLRRTAPCERASLSASCPPLVRFPGRAASSLASPLLMHSRYVGLFTGGAALFRWHPTLMRSGHSPLCTDRVKAHVRHVGP